MVDDARGRQRDQKITFCDGCHIKDGQTGIPLQSYRKATASPTYTKGGILCATLSLLWQLS